MDSAHWPQGIGVVDKAPMEGSKQPNNNNESRGTTTRPQKDQAVNCPRCNSTNTKFCYYNNYSLTQPRFFCKTCRRYWTDGGSLRNVPVGGGSRKNKRSSSSSSSSSQLPSSSSNKKLLINNNNSHDHLSPSPILPPSLNFSLASQDLNLAYHDHQNMSKMSFSHHYDMSSVTNPSTTTTSTSTTIATKTSSSSSSQHVSAMELLKSSGISSRGLMSSLMPIPVVVPDHQFSNSYPNLGHLHHHHHEFKPSLISFGLDHHYHPQGLYNNNNNNNNVHHGVVQETSGARLLFPSEDLKQVSSTTTTNNNNNNNNTSSTQDHHQNQGNRGQGDNSTGGYNWNGMLGGEGSW